jgi:hypothetical protein
MRRSLAPLFVFAASLAACGDDSTSTGSGGSGGSGTSSTTAGTGGEGPATGAGGAGSGGAAPANDVSGELAGDPFEARGASARFSDDAVATDSGYVSVSVIDTEADCTLEEVCPGGAVNFTLYVVGGRVADVRPGLYVVGGEERDGFSYEVVGGAGRYDAECGTGESGFARFLSGSVTLETVADGVGGTLDLTLETGETLKGHFGAIDCTDL